MTQGGEGTFTYNNDSHTYIGNFKNNLMDMVHCM